MIEILGIETVRSENRQVLKGQLKTEIYFIFFMPFGRPPFLHIIEVSVDVDSTCELVVASTLFGSASVSPSEPELSVPASCSSLLQARRFLLIFILRNSSFHKVKKVMLKAM